jgi:purine-binding chemotaxis protein CheW
MNSLAPGATNRDAIRDHTTRDHADADANCQYVTFICADAEYGIPILKVQEIKGWEPVTRMPCMPDDLLGVLNLRGVVVPVVDLRRVLGLGERTFDAETAVVLVHTCATSRPSMAGLVVDAVSEVHRIGPDLIRAAPELDAESGDIRLTGVAALADKLVLLLDVDPMIRSICRSAQAGATDRDAAAIVAEAMARH